MAQAGKSTRRRRWTHLSRHRWAIRPISPNLLRGHAEERPMYRRRQPWALIIATLFGSVLLTVPAATPAAAADPWIDTADRGAVLAAWEAEFERTEPAMDYTGDVDSCTVGTTSQAYRDSVLQRVNWYRRMAGLGTVTENTTYTSRNQQAALMMSAQRQLSHYPSSTWACHTVDGATAAGKSNLALGIAGIEAIDAYMADFGTNNTKVGHRRAILYPQVQEMGTGDVPYGESTWASNTLYVFDTNLWADRPDVRESRDFVAWPPSGYVPAEAVWGRWSFSLARADFSAASVSVAGPDGPLDVEILQRIQAGTRIAPEASIVFAVDGDTNSEVFATPTDGDECYTVTIDGVTQANAPLDTFEYITCLLDPSIDTPPVISIDRATGETEICPGLAYAAWDTPCWEASGTLPFFDVTASWQRGPVAWMVGNAITTGVDRHQFAPDRPVTRAEAATFIWRMAGRPTPPAGAPIFSDVPTGTYYEDAVRWMASTGITNGTSPTEFSPHDIATRAQLVAFLWRLVDRPTVDEPSPFVDLTSDWQDEPVGWAAAIGVTNGKSAERFEPNAPVTRGQAAAMLARLALALGSTS